MLGGLVFICPVTTPQVQASAPEVEVDTDWGKMPLYFISNQGQLDEAVSYYVRGSEKTLYFTEEGLTFTLNAPDQDEPSAAPQKTWTLRLDYLEAEEVTPQGQEKTEAILSYFQGAEEDWVAGVPTYSNICYRGLWEGVDLHPYVCLLKRFICQEE